MFSVEFDDCFVQCCFIELVIFYNKFIIENENLEKKKAISQGQKPVLVRTIFTGLQGN